MFGFMSSEAHLAHIALNGPTTSIEQQSLSLSTCPNFPSPNSYYKPTFELSTLSGERQRQIQLHGKYMGWAEITQLQDIYKPVYFSSITFKKFLTVSSFFIYINNFQRV